MIVQIRMVVAIFLVVALGMLSFQTLIFSSDFLVNRESFPDGFFPGWTAQALDQFLKIVIPVIVVFTGFFFIATLPIGKVGRVLAKGKQPNSKDYQKARRSMIRLPSVVLILCLIGFSGGASIAYIQESPTDEMQFFTIALTVGYVMFGVMVALVVIAIHRSILAPLRRQLNIFYFEGRDRNRGVSMRLRQTMLIISATIFVLGFLINVVGTILLAPTEPDIAMIQTYLVVMAGVLLLVLAAASLVYNSSTSQQMVELRERLHDILAGEGDLTQRIHILMVDELGELTDSINRFMDQLQGILIEVADATDQVTETSDGLTNSIQSATAMTEEVLASIDSIGQNTAQQNQVVGETRDTVTIMLDSLSKVFETVDNQAIYVEQTSSTVNEMVSSIQSVTESTDQANKVASELVEVAKEARRAVLRSMEAIQEIKSASEEVEQIVSLISDVANQTNLLSMNAAIEASHAGLHGKGFAVVADEVRKLAEDSSTRASEIVEQIHTMTERVEKGVTLSQTTEQSLSRITKDIEQSGELIHAISGAMNEQSSGAGDILKAVSTVVDATNQIRNSALEEKKNSEMIRMAMEQLMMVSMQIGNSVHEQTEANREIMDLIGSVNDAVGRNKGVVDRLRALVDRFHLGERPDPNADEDELAARLILSAEKETPEALLTDGPTLSESH